MITLVILLSAALIATSNSADRLVMIDNSTLEGEIERQSDDSVTITTESPPGSGVYIEKEILRSEIRTIELKDEETDAFNELKALGLPDTSDNVAPYDKVLLGKIATYLSSYPEGKFREEAIALRDEALAERGRIAAGEVKISGTWMARKELENNPEASGLLYLSTMQLDGSSTQTMIAFETLQKNYSSTSSFPAAVEIARVKLDKLADEVGQAKTDLERKLREREQGLQLASADKRETMKKGIVEENNAVKAAVERARQIRQRWLPLLPDAKLLDDLDRLVKSEKKRLASIDTAKMHEAVEITRAAKEQLNAGDLAGAQAAWDRAKSLWPQYGQLAPLQESLKKAQDEAARRAKEEAKPAAS